MKDNIQYSQGEFLDSEILSDDLSHRDQRSLIFHLLYAVDAYDYDVSLESIAENFARGFGIIVQPGSKVFSQVEAIINERAELDKIINSLLANWRFERLGTATRLILRFGIWELLHTEIDPVIIINEAIELAKCFAEKDSYKFINGILDEYVKKNKPEAEAPAE